MLLQMALLHFFFYGQVVFHCKYASYFFIHGVSLAGCTYSFQDHLQLTNLEPLDLWNRMGDMSQKLCHHQSTK